MKEILTNIAYAFVLNQGYTLAEVPKFLHDPEYRKRFYDKLEPLYPQVKEFWVRHDNHKNLIPFEQFGASINKTNRFQRSRTMRCIFGQATNSINFREAMDTGKIIIVKFSDIGEGNAEFVGAFVVLELWRAILSRRNIPKEARRPFHIIADEFYTYMTNAFYKIQDQGRKAGVDVVIAHQHRSQIHDTEMQGSTRAVGNKVLFRVSGDDGKDFAREFKQEKPQPTVRQQQKFALVANVLEHLATKGHTDTSIIALSRVAQYIVDRLFVYALEHQEQEMAIAAQMRTMHSASEQYDAQDRTIPLAAPTPLYGQRAELVRNQIKRVLNEVLFATMSAEDEDEVERLWHPDGMANRKLTQLVDDIYGNQFSQVDRHNVSRLRARTALIENGVHALLQAHTEVTNGALAVTQPGSFIWHRTQLLWEWESALRLTIFRLGRALWNDPCRDRSGQLEDVAERTRPLSDIEGELANRLSNLPRFWAHVTITTDEKNAEPEVFTIKSLSPLSANDESRKQGQVVAQSSRENYGHDRDEVEAAIRARLEGNTPTTTQTAENQSPDPSTPSPEAAPKKKRTIVLIEIDAPIPRIRTKPVQRLESAPRDDRILADIFEHGALTAEQIAALNFPPNGKFEDRVFPVTDVSSACYMRLRKLSGYHYLEQRKRSHTDLGMKGLLHRLSKEGITVLATQLDLAVEDLLSSRRQTVPKGDLEHFILINDMWIALKIATSQHQASIVTWISESEFKKDPLIVPADATLTGGKSKAQEFVPDGYFHLEIARNQRRTLHRFVEIDRGKETGISTKPIYRTWETKVNLYQQYHDSGAYEKRFGTQQMAILTVTTSEERLANLKRITENAGGASWFWFTTFDKATSDAILTKPIWQLAGATGLAPMVWEGSDEPPLS